MIAMTSEEARQFLVQKGIPMSKSRLYKLVSSRKIDFHRVSNRLLFYKEEIEVWSKNQITTPRANKNEALESVIQSAQKSC